MRIADIWINEPFEDIGTDKACFVASQRDYEEIADDDREWEKSADSFDYVSKLLSGKFEFFGKENYQEGQNHSNQIEYFADGWVIIIVGVHAVEVTDVNQVQNRVDNQ